MADNQLFIDRIANGLTIRGSEYRIIKMMGGMCFMVDDKMCVGTHKDKTTGDSILIARVGKENYEASLEISGASPFDFTGRPLSGFVQVTAESIETDDQLQNWIDRCLAYNPLAKKSKKKKKKS